MVTYDEAKARLKEIVFGVRAGIIEYDKGREMAKPYLPIYNEKLREIAKKHNKRFYPVSWVVLRNKMMI